MITKVERNLHSPPSIFELSVGEVLLGDFLRRLPIQMFVWPLVNSCEGTESVLLASELTDFHVCHVK